MITRAYALVFGGFMLLEGRLAAREGAIPRRL
jgi:hypothetical protein